MIVHRRRPLSKRLPLVLFLGPTPDFIVPEEPVPIMGCEFPSIGKEARQVVSHSQT